MSAYYDEVLANLTWYQLNSNFNDPMYQYMYKLERQLYATIMTPLLKTNYSVEDDYVIYNKIEILQYGSYECSASRKLAYMDSWFSCFLFQLPFFLEKIQIGFIGFAFTIPIMLISIFGGIKESYRWFILNQAIWDAFLCYDFICASPTLIGWPPKNSSKNLTCFYTIFSDLDKYGPAIYIFMKGFPIFLRNASFIPVFHLAFSRLICMYFPRFYKNFTKNGYKILCFILIFNFICITIFCIANVSLQNSSASFKSEFEEKCGILCLSKNHTFCIQNIPKYFQCFNGISINLANSVNDQTKAYKNFKYITYLIPPLMFFLSIICAGFLICKIASQLKFQLQTNRDSFKQTIKSSSIVGFQCFTMSIIFFATSIQKFMQIKQGIVGTLNIYNDLSPWIFLAQYYPTTTSLNMIRIILDSFIILIVLNGYSKCVIATLKLIHLCSINPKKVLKKIKSNLKGSNSVTIISAFKP